MKLQEGEIAPNFTAKDQNGKEISLSEFKGKKVVLYFYPKDNTPGCTKQACNLRDNYSLFKKKGYEIIGVSADSEKKHQNFIEKFKLPFPLISDPDKDLITKYGCWGKKKFMGREYEGIIRTTFVIDENGQIEKIIDKVKTADHTDQII